MATISGMNHLDGIEYMHTTGIINNILLESNELFLYLDSLTKIYNAIEVASADICSMLPDMRQEVNATSLNMEKFAEAFLGSNLFETTTGDHSSAKSTVSETLDYSTETEKSLEKAEYLVYQYLILEYVFKECRHLLKEIREMMDVVQERVMCGVCIHRKESEAIIADFEVKLENILLDVSMLKRNELSWFLSLPTKLKL